MAKDFLAHVMDYLYGSRCRLMANFHTHLKICFLECVKNNGSSITLTLELTSTDGGDLPSPFHRISQMSTCPIGERLTGSDLPL